MPGRHLVTCRRTGLVFEESQAMIELLVIKDLVENSVVEMKWVQTTRMLADALTTEMHMTYVLSSFLEGRKYALHQIMKEAEREEHRRHVTQQHRRRRKERDRTA